MYEYKELYTLDFSKVKYYLEFHTVLKKGLDFPEYYGCNWDALWDCLTDMVGDPINIEILGLDNIERRFGKDTVEMFVEILKKIKHYNNDRYSHEINIAVVNGDERILIE